MARDKYIDAKPKFLPVDLARQLRTLPAQNHSGGFNTEFFRER